MRLFLVALLALSGAAHSAIINVDETVPGSGIGMVVVAADSLCSLREAIISANNDSAPNGDCENGSANDAINLPSGAVFTVSDAHVSNDAIYGNTGLPYITSNILISGAGATIERDTTLPACVVDGTQAATEFRLLTYTAGFALTLEDLDLVNGCAGSFDSAYGHWGGGVLIDNGRLFLVRSTMRGHEAIVGSAVSSPTYAEITIDQSVVHANGGTFATGTVRANTGFILVRNSTFSGNMLGATDSGDVHCGDCTITLEQTTIVEQAPLAFASNAVFIDEDGTANVKNSVIDGSCGSRGMGSPTFNAFGDNFESGTSCATAFGGGFNSNATLDLQPLGDNGGPTWTHALGGSSDALDALSDCTFVDTSVVATDQRGVSRPRDGDGDTTAVCDAGAFEAFIDPTISIQDVTVAEGDAGSTGADFTVTLSEANPLFDVTVDYTTSAGTATAGSDYENTYEVVAGTLTIPAGSPSGTITIQVLGDTTDEPDETFSVNLSNPGNATIADGTGEGTITDDDVLVADLALTLSVDTDGSPQAGETITYNLTLTNNGPDGAPDSTVTLNLPDNVSFTGYTADPGVTCAEVGGVVTCDVGTLANDDSVDIAVSAQITDGGSLEATASASSSGSTDPNAANSSAVAAGAGIFAAIPAVPTLNQWGLILMILAFMGLAGRRRWKHGRLLG